ncbi:MAG: response regulator transcription factor [Roseiflexaceae bacterium]|nr:response regulator transcription factor [Roseiflexaceae bacterium]
MRVIICDDQATVRDGLRLMLGLEPDIEVVGAAQNGADAVELAAKTVPDVVLMDLQMPVLNGIEATRQITRRFPNTRVLVLTTYDADEWVFDAIRAGAVGYLLKDTTREDLVAAVRGTSAGKTYIDPTVAGKLLQQFARGNAPAVASMLADQLSERELEVLRLLARGLSNPDIANALHLSEGTVRNYVSGLFTKLGVADRTQAAVLALRHGLA